MMVSRRFLEAIGLMDESYFLYFEEMDWAIGLKTNSDWVGRLEFCLA